MSTPQRSPNKNALIQRRIITAAYEDAGRPYLVSSKPYESTLPVVLTRVSGKAPAEPDPAAPGPIFYVARANQVLEFFSYGRSANNNAGVGGALVDDTNIVAARKTNGSEDFVIEGISLTHRSTRFVWEPESIADALGSSPASADTDVRGAFGDGPMAAIPAMFDPSALYVPMVAQSPVMLEDGLLHAIAPHLHLELLWGTRRAEQIGCLDNVPEGAAKSLLRASGMPSTDNRFRVPEGYLWRKSGADEDFVARATLARPIVIPATTVLGPNMNGPSAPAKILVDLKLRLHGVAFSFPSRN